MPDLVGPVLPANALSVRDQPELRVDELTLRPWRPDDATAVHEAYDDPAITQWHVRTLTSAEAREWISTCSRRWRTDSGADWAVTDQHGLVGRVGLRRVDLVEGHGEVAYWVVPAARGRGVAPRALHAMADWLFSVVQIHRLELAHSVLNTGSCRVATKAGFELEGTLRQQLLHADGWHDMHLHGRLAAR